MPVTKAALLSVLARDQLLRIADHHGLRLEDRRKTEEIRRVVRRAHRTTVESVGRCLHEADLERVCADLCMSETSDRKETLLALLTGESPSDLEESSDEERRDFALQLSKCQPPATAVGDATSGYVISLDLRRMFHQGMQEFSNRFPAVHTNPLLSLYHQLLAPTKDFRFSRDGLASYKEARIGPSNILGRIVARAYLDQHLNYRWFAPIQSLIGSPWRDWTAERTSSGGETPDWLVTRNGDAALAEAKGTQSPVSIPSARLTKWRQQLKNVVIKKGGVAKSLDGYIVAPRWVTVDQPGQSASLFVEDPPADRPPDGRNADEPPDEGMELFAATRHVSRNLRRLGLFRLALLSDGALPPRDSARVPLFRCVLPGLSGRLFVGRFLLYPEGGSPWPWGPMIFDGLDLQTVTDIRAGIVPDLAPYVAEQRESLEEASLLTDGSLLVSSDLMEPAGEKNLA